MNIDLPTSNFSQMPVDETDYFIDDDSLFVGDGSVPEETIVYYAKGKNYLMMGILIGCSAIGIYMLSTKQNFFVSMVLMLSAAYFAYVEFRHATNKKPQIILNNKGIKTISTPFHSWTEISDDKVIFTTSVRWSHYYLSYKSPSGDEFLLIDDYEISEERLKFLLKIYRRRFGKITPKQQ